MVRITNFLDHAVACFHVGLISIRKWVIAITFFGENDQIYFIYLVPNFVNPKFVNF